MNKKAISIILVALLFTAVAIYLYLNQIGNKNAVTNVSDLTYEECMKLRDSKVENSLPPVCITTDGIRIVGTIQEKNKKELIENTDTTNWEVFENELISTRLSYPPSWGEPRVSSSSSKNQVEFNNSFTISRGVYYTNERDRTLSYDEFIERNTPGRRIITNYEINNTPIKRASYDYSSTQRAELLTFPPNENGEIISIYFHYQQNNLAEIREFFGVLSTIEKLENPAPTLVPFVTSVPEKGCVITGCSSQICAEEETITTCEYKEEYACYASATCERQDNGECGWTMTVELQSCLETS